MANCNYKVKITDIQNKYRFKIFCAGSQVDLTNYVTFDDYAASNKGGVIKTATSTGLYCNPTGLLLPTTKNYSEYSSSNQYLIINKGTLENVLTEKIGSIDSVLDAINGEVI